MIGQFFRDLIVLDCIRQHSDLILQVLLYAVFIHQFLILLLENTCKLIDQPIANRSEDRHGIQVGSCRHHHLLRVFLHLLIHHLFKGRTKCLLGLILHNNLVVGPFHDHLCKLRTSEVTDCIRAKGHNLL